jgi:hypothetical protein
MSHPKMKKGKRVPPTIVPAVAPPVTIMPSGPQIRIVSPILLPTGSLSAEAVPAKEGEANAKITTHKLDLNNFTILSFQ